MLELDYSDFTDDMLRSGLTCLVLSFVLPYVAYTKHPYLSWAYPIFAFGVAALMRSCGILADDFEPATLRLYDNVCYDFQEFGVATNIAQLQLDMSTLVDKWMCIGECPCDESAKELWYSYDEVVLMNFGRNQQDMNTPGPDES